MPKESRLRYFRELREYTIAQLAGQTGVPYNVISNAESTRGVCGPGLASRLAPVLSISTLDLLGEPPVRKTPKGGPRLRAMRREAGLSRRQLAVEADCDAMTIAAIEHGILPDAATAQKLATFFNVKVSFLFSQLASSYCGYPSKRGYLQSLDENSDGGRLRRIRHERNLTQYELGSLCGQQGNVFISDIERGARVPNAEHRAMIAAALEVDESAIWPSTK